MAVKEKTEEEYTLFVYVGPSLPSGSLKENAILQGTFEDIRVCYQEVFETYPQTKNLIVPVHKLGEFSAKVKTPGNAVHKYYNDIVSSMQTTKEG